MNKLCESKIHLLIDMVRVNPCLYDKRHPGFKKLITKENLWREFAEKLNADQRDIKVAWRSLRDQFIKSLKYCKKSADATEKIRRYKNFERLSFLADSLEGEGNPLKYEGEMPEVPTEFLDAEQTTQSFDFVPWPESTEMLSEESTTDQWPITTTSTAKKRKISETKQTFPEFLEDLASKEDSQESFNVEIFFHSIANTVKSFQLTPREFAGLQSDVMAFVIDRFKRIDEMRWE